MRLLITEYIVGGGMANDLIPEGLRQEGSLMLSSVIADCEALDHIELVTTIDSRIRINTASTEKIYINEQDEYFDELTKLAHQCDAVWVIAPESDHILYSFIERLGESNSLVNCDAESIRITSDKLLCTETLSNSGLLTIENLTVNQAEKFEHQTLVKNRYGVGAEGMTIFQSGAEALVEVKQRSGDWLIQPYIEGQSLSLSILCVNGNALVLTCNEQVFTSTNEPRLIKCLVNAIPIDDEINAIAQNIARVIPGLKGYIGVDFIRNNQGSYIVDINPRLTSSYSGLNKILKSNPAMLCIDASLKGTLPVNIERNSIISEVNIG